MIFLSQIILKELCFMLEKEVFSTPSFSLQYSQARLQTSWVILLIPLRLDFYKIHSMPPHYSFSFPTDLSRKLQTKL